MCSGPGSCSEFDRLHSRGLASVNSDGRAAITVRIMMRIAGMMNMGLRRSWRQASYHRPPSSAGARSSGKPGSRGSAANWEPESGTSWSCRTASSPRRCRSSLITDPWVEDGVEEVYEQGGDDEDEHQER